MWRLFVGLPNNKSTALVMNYTVYTQKKNIIIKSIHITFIVSQRIYRINNINMYFIVFSFIVKK